MAIGLVGGVSVPLYYTSPPHEIDELVTASGAKLVLIGSEELLKRVGELRTQAPAVCFCHSVPEGEHDAIAWDDFLKMESQDHESSPSVFSDLATIRYTSSTTGKAKGVRFDHQHLRRMAESTAALPPWNTRNSEIFHSPPCP